MNVITEELKFADLFPDEAGKVAQRLHVKKDEIPFIRKSYISEKSEVKPKERAVISYISTMAKDRDGEQLLPEGVQLDNYRNNPIVLFGHDYRSMPVGKNLWIKQDDKGLIAKTVFANNERGEEMLKAYSEDIGGTGPLLAGWSVGFIPVEWEDTETKELEKNKDLPKRVYKRWELLEYSAVPIPSCPEALTLAVEKGLVPESMKEALDKYIEIEDFQVDVEIENESKTMTPDELKEFYRKERTIEVVSDEEDVEIEIEKESEPDLQDTVNELVELGIEDVDDLALDESEEKDVDVTHEELPPDSEVIGFLKALLDEKDKRIETQCEYITELKEGRVLSTKNRILVKDIRDMIRELDSKLTELLDITEPPEKAERFSCECIECGHKLTSEEHCKDIECPKCGGAMRRIERPGPGREIEVEVVKDVDLTDAMKKALENAIKPESIQKAIDLSIKKLQGKVE